MLSQLFSTHPSTDDRIARLQPCANALTEVRSQSAKRRDRVARPGHPWIFSSDVTDRGEAQPGDAVQVVDPQTAARSGTAHYSSTSQICLRLLSAQVEAIDRAFFAGDWLPRPTISRDA